jgi:hypothetical protein
MREMSDRTLTDDEIEAIGAKAEAAQLLLLAASLSESERGAVKDLSRAFVHMWREVKRTRKEHE